MTKHLNTELEQLNDVWHGLNWYQRKWLRVQIAFVAFPHRAYRAMKKYIENRRAHYAYWFPAHWIQ